MISSGKFPIGLKIELFTIGRNYFYERIVLCLTQN
jgi:hypothetical protein